MVSKMERKGVSYTPTVIDKNGVHFGQNPRISYMPLDFPSVHEYEVKQLISGKYALHRRDIRKPTEEALIQNGWSSNCWANPMYLMCGYSYYTFSNSNDASAFAKKLRDEEEKKFPIRLANYTHNFSKDSRV